MTSAGHPECCVVAVPCNSFPARGCATPRGGESSRFNRRSLPGPHKLQRQNDRAPAQIGERPRPSSVRSISRSA